jgi:flagellar motility protein MotE (MotC chaperone)
MARIRQMQRSVSGSQPTSPSSASALQPVSDQVAELRNRVAHLEQLVQGLQDSVHRASQRQDDRLSEIEKRLDPAVIAAALSQDARDRGL